MPVQSVDRAIAILRAFSTGESRLGVTELSRRLDLHKSTVHRLLASLLEGGLVDRAPGTRQYRLGIGLIELGYTVLNSRGLAQVAQPYLHYLADKVEEVTYMAVREGDEIVNLLQVPGPQLVQSVPWLGRAPLHCTSTGKIFLAHMSEDELEPLLEKGLPRLTEKTIADPTELRRELERVRGQGYATAWEEYQEGTNAVAVPLTNPDDIVIAAMSAVGPTYRFTQDKALNSLDIIRSIAREISQKVVSLPSDVDLL